MIRCKDCDMAFAEDRLTDGRCPVCHIEYEDYLSPSAFDVFRCLAKDCGKDNLFINLGKGEKCFHCKVGSTFNTEDDNYERQNTL